MESEFAGLLEEYNFDEVPTKILKKWPRILDDRKKLPIKHWHNSTLISTLMSWSTILISKVEQELLLECRRLGLEKRSYIISQTAISQRIQTIQVFHQNIRKKWSLLINFYGKKVMKTKILATKLNKVCELTTLICEKHMVDTKWVFVMMEVKPPPKIRARLVAKGFTEKYGEN